MRIKDIPIFILLAFNSLALLAWPFALAFNLLLCFGSWPFTYVVAIQVMSFMAASTLYPIVYLAAAMLSSRASGRGNTKRALAYQASLSVYLVITILLALSHF